MKKTTYEDYKYSMQDVSSIYIGAKYSFKELLDDEDLLFKFKLIVEKYILPEADLEDSLETHLYYLEPDSFLVKIYNQLKARIKVNVIEEKKDIFGKKRKEYITKVLNIDELAGMDKAEKECLGMVIQELKVSKLSMLSF